VMLFDEDTGEDARIRVCNYGMGGRSCHGWGAFSAGKHSIGGRLIPTSEHMNG
jgi:hypothetical protein